MKKNKKNIIDDYINDLKKQRRRCFLVNSIKVFLAKEKEIFLSNKEIVDVLSRLVDRGELVERKGIYFFS